MPMVAFGHAYTTSAPMALRVHGQVCGTISLARLTTVTFGTLAFAKA